eukprot:scaffold211095_cov18-Tisochrysis_lutea.AAC.1
MRGIPMGFKDSSTAAEVQGLVPSCRPHETNKDKCANNFEAQGLHGLQGIQWEFVSPHPVGLAAQPSI